MSNEDCISTEFEAGYRKGASDCAGVTALMDALQATVWKYQALLEEAVERTPRHLTDGCLCERCDYHRRVVEALNG